MSPVRAWPSGKSEHWSEREPGIPSGGMTPHLRVPSLQPGRTTSLTAQGAGMVGILLGPPEMLQKPVLGKTSTTLRELENQVDYAGRPRGVNSPRSEPRTKGLQSFYRQTIVGNTSC